MAKKKETTIVDMSVEEKLKSLYQLQLMLSEMDKIRILRGELPLEVEDLEDTIYNQDLTDVADIFVKMIKDNKGK